MYRYEKGQFDHALVLYDRIVWPDGSTFYMDIQNAVSLLARLEPAGASVGERWEELASAAVKRQEDHMLLFTEPHYAMTYGRTGRQEEAKRQLASLHAFADGPDATAAGLADPVVVPLCEAIEAYYRGDYGGSRRPPAAAALRLSIAWQQPRAARHLRPLPAGRRPQGRPHHSGPSLLRERLARHPNSAST